MGATGGMALRWSCRECEIGQGRMKGTALNRDELGWGVEINGRSLNELASTGASPVVSTGGELVTFRIRLTSL
jgi:hypothetical protein